MCLSAGRLGSSSQLDPRELRECAGDSSVEWDSGKAQRLVASQSLLGAFRVLETNQMNDCSVPIEISVGLPLLLHVLVVRVSARLIFARVPGHCAAF